MSSAHAKLCLEGPNHLGPASSSEDLKVPGRKVSMYSEPHQGTKPVSFAESAAVQLNQLAVLQAFGAYCQVLGNGEVYVRINVLDAIHLGGAAGNAVNGAVLMGLLDCACAGAAWVSVRGRACATIEMASKLYRPIQTAGFVARGWCVARTGSLIFSRAEITQEGQLMAEATATIVRLKH